MNGIEKPIDDELAMMMGKKSELCALYGSMMKWDFLRRQNIEDVRLTMISYSCPLCKRHKDADDCKGKNGKCSLFVAAGSCENNGGIYENVIRAFDNRDQQAFTQHANDLYYLLCKLINDYYEEKPEKKEVFYHKGQRFEGPCGQYILAAVGSKHKMLMVNAGDGCYFGESHSVANTNKITESEFATICNGGEFTLIEK